MLVEYQKWVKRNPDASPLTFLSRLFGSWGIVPIDWDVTDEEGVRKLAETKGTELSVCNEAMVALAFAAMKVKGECPTEVVDLALKALQRESYGFMEDGMEEKTQKLHGEAIGKMRAKLARR